MENAWKEIQPKTIYRPLKAVPLKEEGRTALLYLYQPLIGGEALSAYLTLLSEISVETGMGEETLHADLLSGLSCGITQFYEARKRLEGIGLMETYAEQDESLGTILSYLLLEPLSPEHFFKDSVLAYLLLEKVGERRFEQLKEKFRPKQFSFERAKKITKKFLDVYRFSEESFASETKTLEETAEAFTTEDQSPLLENGSDLDWNLLNELLKKKHIQQLDDQTIKQLEIFSQLYGLDVMAVEELVVQAYDFSKQSVDLYQMQKLLSNQYKRHVPKKTEEATNEPPRQKVSKPQTAYDVLLYESKTFAPAEYLEAIKQAKNGFVTDSERRLLENLVRHSNLSRQVINVLINYVLVVQNKASLTATYVNSIANEWAQKKISDPEAAVTHIRELSKEAKNKTKKRSGSTPYRNVRREKLPDWVNQPTEEKPVDHQKQAELEQRFKEYMAKKEGDS